MFDHGADLANLFIQIFTLAGGARLQFLSLECLGEPGDQLGQRLVAGLYLVHNLDSAVQQVLPLTLCRGTGMLTNQVLLYLFHQGLDGSRLVTDNQNPLLTVDAVQ